MTFAEFNIFQHDLLQEVVGMKDTKGKEYAHSTNRFANFDRLAEGLGLPNTVIAWVYCKKHVDGVESYVRDNKTYSTEGVRGRIVDAIVYLTLIAGMIEEDGIKADLHLKNPIIAYIPDVGISSDIPF